MKIIFSFLLFLMLLSCKTYNDSDKILFDNKIKTFIKKNNLNLTKSESGLYFQIEKTGSGTNVKFTDEVSFKYVGKLLNGKVFDSKFKKNPATFKVSALIEGWKEAMLYMRKGDKAKLIIPPYLGYADYELDAIPKNSILYFEIEVVGIN